MSTLSQCQRTRDNSEHPDYWDDSLMDDQEIIDPGDGDGEVEINAIQRSREA